MLYVYIALLLVLNLLWLFTVVLGLPGNWLIVGSALLFEWWREEEIFSVWVLGGVTALAVAGEVFEFVSGVVGSKKAGGSGWGALGSLFGAIAGAIVGTIFIPIPVLGSILGVCGGAFAGAVIFELLSGRTMDHSLRSGKGAAVGRFLGVSAKLLVGAAIWVIIAVAAFL